MITCPDCGVGVLPDQPPFKSATDLNTENKELRSVLREVIDMACPTERSQARLSQGLQAAILRARKVLSKSE